MQREIDRDTMATDRSFVPAHLSDLDPHLSPAPLLVAICVVQWSALVLTALQYPAFALSAAPLRQWNSASRYEWILPKPRVHPLRAGSAAGPLPTHIRFPAYREYRPEHCQSPLIFPPIKSNVLGHEPFGWINRRFVHINTSGASQTVRTYVLSESDISRICDCFGIILYNIISLSDPICDWIYWNIILHYGNSLHILPSSLNLIYIFFSSYLEIASFSKIFDFIFCNFLILDGE